MAGFLLQVPNLCHSFVTFNFCDQIDFDFIMVVRHVCIGYVCYDDGCHLRKFARHPSRKDITETAKHIASLEILVDKMHMAGHIDTRSVQREL